MPVTGLLKTFIQNGCAYSRHARWLPGHSAGIRRFA